MPAQAIRSTAWLLSGLTKSVEGALTLTRGQLVFTAHDGRRMFDAALGDLSSVTFPWYYFGGGMKMRIGANRYRISFVRPGNLAEDFRRTADAGDIASGREAGAAWKAALAAARYDGAVAQEVIE